MMKAKNTQTTTIEISIESQGKLRSTAEKLEKILHKKHITPDQVIKVFYETNPLDVVLQKLLTEDEW
jgi:hypothetical protein